MFFDTLEVERAIIRELHAIGADWVAGAHEYLRKNNTNYRGVTFNTVYYKVFGLLEEIVLEAGSESGYSYWVEYGRGPGKEPPRHKIRAWVQIKLGITEIRQLEVVTTRIVKKIAEKGTEAQPFIGASLEDLLPEIPGRLERAIVEALEKESA